MSKFNRSNSKGQVSRQKEDCESTTTTYPANSQARKRVNTAVNKQHGRFPVGWFKSDSDA